MFTLNLLVDTTLLNVNASNMLFEFIPNLLFLSNIYDAVFYILKKAFRATLFYEHILIFYEHEITVTLYLTC